MISDTCREAKAEIRHYLNEQPSTYKPFAREIAAVWQALEVLETALVEGPGSSRFFAADQGPNVSCTDLIDALRREAIRSIRL